LIFVYKGFNRSLKCLLDVEIKKYDSRILLYSEIFRPTLIGNPDTDHVFAKIKNIFKEIQKSKKTISIKLNSQNKIKFNPFIAIQELPLNENFVLSDRENEIDLSNDWLRTLLKQSNYKLNSIQLTF